MTVSWYHFVLVMLGSCFFGGLLVFIGIWLYVVINFRIH